VEKGKKESSSFNPFMASSWLSKLKATLSYLLPKPELFSLWPFWSGLYRLFYFYPLSIPSHTTLRPLGRRWNSPGAAGGAFFPSDGGFDMEPS
jgi:hypothetical protein